MTEEELKKLEEFEDIFGNTPFQNIQKIKEYIQNNFVSVDLYNKEKEKNKKLIEGKFREVANKNDYIKENYISKDKIQKIVDECIPKKENIITGELEYSTNANANSFLAQEILNLLNKE